MGCLTAPFKLIGCLGLLILLGLGWLYRDRLEGEARRLIERARDVVPSASETASTSTAATPSATGRPGVMALKTARAKVDSLNGWRADSVVLTPSEFASLVASHAELAAALKSPAVPPVAKRAVVEALVKAAGDLTAEVGRTLTLLADRDRPRTGRVERMRDQAP